MATKTYNIDINVQSKTLGQLEDQLSQVNEELKQVDRNSEAFKNLTKEAQSLNAEIKRTNTEIEGFTFEKKIEAADGAVKLMAGSLASVVGVLGTLGIESEAFGDLERKAASAIAVAIGIKDVSEGIQRLSPALKAAGVAFQNFGKVTKTALITTGVGLFVVAIGTIASYWDDIKIAIGLTKDENEKLNDSFEKTLGYSDDIITLLRLEKGILALKEEDQEEINKKLLKELEAQIAITEQMILQNEIALQEKEEENSKITRWEKIKMLFNQATGNLTGYAVEYAKAVDPKSEETEALEGIIQGAKQRLLELKTDVVTTENEIVQNRQVNTVNTVVGVTEFAGKMAEIFVNANKITTSVSDATGEALAKNKEDYLQGIREQNAADQARQQVLLETAGALGGLSMALGQGTAAGKAAAVAEIALTTGVGFAQALDIAQKSARGTGPAAAFAFPIFYATQIAAVLGAIGQAKEIISGVQGGPAVPVVNQGSIPQTPTLSEEAIPVADPTATAAVRAYVVAGDTRSAAEAEAKIQTRRTFGS